MMDSEGNISPGLRATGHDQYGASLMYSRHGSVAFEDSNGREIQTLSRL